MKYILTSFFFLLSVLAFVPAHAQKSSELRTVLGTAVDKDDNPIASAVIYLKNARTQTVKTYISEDNGSYRFSGLDPNADYEIHAEHGELTSSSHTVSSFDNRKEIVVSLKVIKEKKSGGK